MNWQEKNEGWETYQLKEIKDPYPNQPNGKKKKKDTYMSYTMKTSNTIWIFDDRDITFFWGARIVTFWLFFKIFLFFDIHTEIFMIEII